MGRISKASQMNAAREARRIFTLPPWNLKWVCGVLHEPRWYLFLDHPALTPPCIISRQSLISSMVSGERLFRDECES